MRDTPKPDLKYKTKTLNQFQAKTVDDCVWYAVNDTYEYVTEGKVHVKDPEEFRKESTGSASGPSKLSIVLAKFSARFPDAVSFTQSPGQGFTKDQAVAALEQGAGLVVLGDYENLPVYYRRWTNNDKFDHAVGARLFNPDHKLFKGSRGSTWMYDPLGGGHNNNPYDGEWIAVEWLFDDFAWRTGTRVSIAVIDEFTEETMISVDKDQTAPRTATIKAGTEVRKDPDAASPVATKFKNQTDVPYIGTTRDGWHAILTKVDNLLALKVAYVYKTAIKTIKDVPATPTDDELLLENAQLRELIEQRDLTIKMVNQRLSTANTRLKKIDKEAVTA